MASILIILLIDKDYNFESIIIVESVLSNSSLFDTIFRLLKSNSLTTFRIRKIGVLGAGLMGSGIACHLAGAGYKVLLLDRASPGADKNKLVNESLKSCLLSKPSPIYRKDFTARIDTGNFEDDFQKLQTCDWIIEAIVEELTAKIELYEKIESVRHPYSIISSNTSGLPIHMLTKKRSDEFKSHFVATHFFNPPRYLPLLEIIPCAETKSEVIEFMMDFGSRFLGKQTVLCKDRPGFIANRIIIPYMVSIMELCESLGLPIYIVDKLTGPAMGRPKSGTFRLADLVGLDTSAMVFKGLKEHCRDDIMLHEIHQVAAFDFLLQQKYFGDKSGKGFYEKLKERDKQGKSQIHALNLQTLVYEPQQNISLESLQLSKQIEDLPRRLKTVFSLDDLGAQLLKKSTAFLFSYSAQRIPEISDTIYGVDQAMCSGFAWELGPFQLWDVLGFQQGLSLIKEHGYEVPEWINRMKEQNLKRFYNDSIQGSECLDPVQLIYHVMPGSNTDLFFSISKKEKQIFENEEIQILDLDDGVLFVNFISKNNIIGEGILRGIQHAIEIAENQGWKGVVIGNTSEHFTVGANLLYIGMMAFQQDYRQLDHAAKLFQETSMRCRYSAIPVVCACQGYTFGGGVELLMHCDASVAYAESYIGLVEMGVGILPCGGGTKEFARKLSLEMKEGEVHMPQLIHRFKTIATAAVSTSAYEAFDMGYLDEARDGVCIQKRTNVRKAKDKVLQRSENYVQPIETGIHVLGQSGLATLYVAANSMLQAAYASEHDVKIARKIAYVLCGGELSAPQKVSEQYLLDLEREAFLSLCAEPKTLERIQYMLENRKPLRN
ncbi:MAG: 3-hydroxyacyl-CoA dehydrogenase/enoyl-CoA hydratase family protein [Saprospiraceae bacterium]|nr:3-hydroxyacyl-CoA dehydrogenase/enoyl-CoA hydratase family protein [Saprospiraceae bacterium]